jgi:hypothetical protein
MLALPVIIFPAPDAKSKKALSGALSFKLFPKGSPEFISGMFSNANFENLNLLIELLNVKDKSSAADEKA